MHFAVVGPAPARDTPAMPAAVDIEAAVAEAQSVRPVDDDRVPAVAAAMARGFEDDPVMRWFFPDDAQRLDQLDQVFRLMLGHRTYRDHYADRWTTGAAVGGALWAPPGRWHVGPFESLGLLPRWAAVAGWRSVPRILRGITAMEKHHPEREHWYLPVVAVEPDWQGRGLGSAILRPALDRCDRERLPAYLEATTTRSRGCYERLGFRTTGEIRLPDGPSMWPMWREPGS